ncbi:helix-turn-helix domain-containing protein [Rhodococcus qingshengii]|uniref:helix-turn-helix domain-containing protein n=1 Tax=Rhodococcus qingshengii TaxID=334542 RepID=UPI001E40ABA7|nr:helix-turn-helix domain-containing protein [Rhodococcus qingshengii]UDF20123.1 helix-turn-helix domain-containing protein [Rhodococcus qingshengii]
MGDEIVIGDDLLTVSVAAELLGVSRPTLVRLLELGEIPFEKPSRHRRVSLADLLAYKSRISERRSEVLAEMTADAAEDDDFRSVNGFIETR